MYICILPSKSETLFRDLKQYHPWENSETKNEMSVLRYFVKEKKTENIFYSCVFWKYCIIIKVLNIVPKICEMFSCLARKFWEIHVIFHFSLLY